MNKVTRGLITSLCLMGASYAGAQTTFYVEGLGRAQVTNEQLQGNVIQSDTVGGNQILEKKNTGGYTLLDLGFNIEKNDKFFLKTILRGRDQFGLFWGEGTTFEFRQITMGGIIGKGIKYELGDVFIERTPYTVFNADVDFTDYESDIFKLRREIAEYENFVQDNSRYLQGFNLNGNLLFAKAIEKLELSAFTVRTSKIRETGEPDVLLSGVSANAIQGDYGNFGLNFVALYDLPVATNTQSLSNTVLTANINPQFNINSDVVIGIESEIGTSSYSIETDLIEKDPFSDFILDARVFAELKKLKLKASLGYINIGNGFRSAGAQTRRINSLQSSQLFNNVAVDTNGALVSRDLAYYDRFTQEDVYQSGVNYKLGLYTPAFDNVMPYGAATPNRKGFVVDVVRGKKEDAFNFTVGLASLSEIVADSTTDSEFRNFLSLNSGVNVNLGKVLDIKRRIVLSAGYQFEQTTRGGVESIDLTSNVIDAGLDVEVVNKVDLMVGYKVFSAVGNEYQMAYAPNNFTRELVATPDYDISEDYLSFGGRFRFTDNAALTLNYNINSFTNGLTDNKDDFNINQLFLNYTMKF